MAAVSDWLLRARKNGTVFLRYEFEILAAPEELYLEWETDRVCSVTVNGQEFSAQRSGRFGERFVRSNIGKATRVGRNTVVLEMDYFQQTETYELFENYYYTHSGVTESMINCLRYDSNVEAVYLFGDFRVFNRSGFRTAENHTLVARSDFVMDVSHDAVDPACLVQQGFPFFSGSVVLSGWFQSSVSEGTLHLEGDYATAEVLLNGMHQQTLWCEPFCRLSGMRIGKNLLQIRLTNSNRNLLGPLHREPARCRDEVSPNTFTCYGEWSREHTCGAYCADDVLIPFGLTGLYLEYEVTE